MLSGLGSYHNSFLQPDDSFQRHFPDLLNQKSSMKSPLSQDYKGDFQDKDFMVILYQSLLLPSDCQPVVTPRRLETWQHGTFLIIAAK
jgi:hypothetical protein